MGYVNLEDPCLFWIIQASANCRRLVFDATLHRKWCISFYRTCLWNSSRDFMSWWLHLAFRDLSEWPCYEIKITQYTVYLTEMKALFTCTENVRGLYPLKKKSVVQQQSTQFRTSEFLKCRLPTGVVLTRFVVLVLHLYISSFIYLVCFSVTLQLASLTTPCWETQNSWKRSMVWNARRPSLFYVPLDYLGGSRAAPCACIQWIICHFLEWRWLRFVKAVVFRHTPAQ